MELDANIWSDFCVLGACQVVRAMDFVHGMGVNVSGFSIYQAGYETELRVEGVRMNVVTMPRKRRNESKTFTCLCWLMAFLV